MQPAEIRNDLSRASAIQGVRQPSQPRSEVTSKQFIGELQKRLHEEKEEEDAKQEKDEIVLGEDVQDEEEQDDEVHKNENEQSRSESAENSIDFLA